MFFAPPQVKSLSKYADFGIYLRQKDFLTMLAIATLIHAVIIGIYSMVPHEQVLRIPVRALNIRLGSGKGIVDMPAPPVASPAPASAMPEPVSMPVQEAVTANTTTQPHEQKPEPAKTPVKIQPLPKPEELVKSVAAPKHVVYSDLSAERNKHRKRLGKPDNTAASADANTLSTPKQYVRENDLSTEIPESGGGSASAAGGNDIVESYEQTISNIIKQRYVYPEAARLQNVQGTTAMSIRIDRQGRVLSTWVSTSSGNLQLDQAALDMVNAAHLPPVPAGYPASDQMEFVIPITFELKETPKK
jgi:periplasmic protein TonB